MKTNGLKWLVAIYLAIEALRDLKDCAHLITITEFIPEKSAVSITFRREMSQRHRTIFGFFISSRQPIHATMSFPKPHRVPEDLLSSVIN